MPQYKPPKRDNLEQLLRVARARVKLPGTGWTDDLMSTRFVRDLIDERILGKTRPGARDGVGQARRLTPTAYRDLLVILALKAQGVKRRSAWIAHLWLRGRELPFDQVRPAFISEFERFLNIMRRDIAPTGRFTEPLSVKYDRRVRQEVTKHPEGHMMPEMVDLVEMVAPLMIRPSAVDEINPSSERIVEEIQSIVPDDANNRIDTQQFSKTVTSAIDSQKVFAEPPESTLENLRAIIDHLLTLLTGHDQGHDLLYQLWGAQFQRIPGMLDDQYGRSRLLKSLKEASGAQYRQARNWLRIVTTGLWERAAHQAEHLVSDSDRLLFDLGMMSSIFYRLLSVQNPDYRLYLFAMLLDDEAKTLVDVDFTKPLDWKEQLRRRLSTPPDKDTKA